METQIAVKDDEKIIRQSTGLVTMANQIQIRDDVTLNQAVDIAQTLKLFMDGPGTYHDESIEMANALHKQLCGKRNAIMDGPKEAYKSIKNQIATYIAGQQRKQEEKQRAAEAEARRIEAEKQAGIQAQIDAENERIQEAEEAEAEKRREEQRKINTQKDKAQAEKMRKEAEERRETEERRMAGESRRAEEKKQELEEKKEAVYVAPKVVNPISVPKGTYVNFTWDAEVFDKAIVPENYKIVDVAMLEKMQKAAKGMMVVPGVRWVKKAIGTLRKSIL